MSYTKIYIALLISLVFYSCSGSRFSIPDLYPEGPVLIEKSIDKKPEWIKKGRSFWYDSKEKGFFVIGYSVSNDADLAYFQSKAIAGANIAGYVQSEINARFKLLKVSNDNEVKNLSELVVNLISQKVTISLATVEEYREVFKEMGQLKYHVYTKNFVGENSLKLAIDEALKRITVKDQPGSEDISKDIIENLKR